MISRRQPVRCATPHRGAASPGTGCIGTERGRRAAETAPEDTRPLRLTPQRARGTVLFPPAGGMDGGAPASVGLRRERRPEPGTGRHERHRPVLGSRLRPRATRHRVPWSERNPPTRRARRSLRTAQGAKSQCRTERCSVQTQPPRPGDAIALKGLWVSIIPEIIQDLDAARRHSNSPQGERFCHHVEEPISQRRV